MPSSTWSRWDPFIGIWSKFGWLFYPQKRVARTWWIIKFVIWKREFVCNENRRIGPRIVLLMVFRSLWDRWILIFVPTSTNKLSLMVVWAAAGSSRKFWRNLLMRYFKVILASHTSSFYESEQVKNFAYLAKRLCRLLLLLLMFYIVFACRFKR